MPSDTQPTGLHARAAKLLAALVTVALLLGIRHASAETLTIATLAPRKSAWGKVFSAWSKALKKKTGGQLELSFYWNGSQGDDGTVVAKLKSGQLDGATLGASGLGEIHRPALALQLPGLFTTWESIDRATTALYPELRDAFAEKGFVLSSIGDVGRARTMSKGRAIRSPADLQGMKPAAPRGSVVAPVVASVLGITPVRVGFAELLPAISAGRINIITVPALAAEQLQWAPFFDHIGTDVSGIGIGAMVLSKKRVDALPADVVEVMLATGARAGQLLRKRVRKMDDKAFARLSGRMTKVTLTDAEKRVWADKFAEVRRRLGQRVFTPALVRRLEQLARL